MAAKSTQPALYEKFRNRGGANPPAPMKTDLGPASPPVVLEPPTAHSGDSWLSPGRTIRVPVGYVMLAVGLLIAILFVVYIMGFQSGKRVEHARMATTLNSNGNDAVNLATVDPLLDTKQPDRSVMGSTPAKSGNPSSGGNPAVRSSPPSNWGPVSPSKDPRTKGLNYFVLMETNEAGATRLADFCRSYGLETYVIPSKNDRRKVIAFPGFDAPARTSQAVKDLESKIVSIGEKWKATEKNATGLREYYPQRFDG